MDELAKLRRELDAAKAEVTRLKEEAMVRRTPKCQRCDKAIEFNWGWVRFGLVGIVTTSDQYILCPGCAIAVQDLVTGTDNGTGLAKWKRPVSKTPQESISFKISG